MQENIYFGKYLFYFPKSMLSVRKIAIGFVEIVGYLGLCVIVLSPFILVVTAKKPTNKDQRECLKKNIIISIIMSIIALAALVVMIIQQSKYSLLSQAVLNIGLDENTGKVDKNFLKQFVNVLKKGDSLYERVISNTGIFS